MNEAEIEELARLWIKLHLLPQDENTRKHPLFSAWEKLDCLVREHPEDAWKVMAAIRKIDSTDFILANVAAGPLEDLLTKHGETFIDRVENLARQDEEFLYMLTGVWGRNRMRKEVWTRLCAITEKSRRHM